MSFIAIFFFSLGSNPGYCIAFDYISLDSLSGKVPQFYSMTDTVEEYGPVYFMECSSVWVVLVVRVQFSSVQFSSSVVSDSLRPHEPQHARPPCPTPNTGACPNSCPLSQWCHPTISSSVIPFSSYPQSFPASGSFQMSQLFASGGQGIGASALTSDLPMNTQDWSPLGWTGWISLQSKALSRDSSNTTVQKHQFFSTQLSL